MDYVEKRMASGTPFQLPISHVKQLTLNSEAAKPTPDPEVYVPNPPRFPRHSTGNLTPHPSATIMTPINLILLSLFLLIAYYQLRPPPRVLLPKAPPATVFRTFTPRTLLPKNGVNGEPVYLAVRGRVFDVTASRNFYGPGGPYANFAGRDASRGLACGSFDADMLTEDLGGPLDKLEDLEAEQLEALRDWEERFSEKYLVVGKLVAVEEEGSSES